MLLGSRGSSGWFYRLVNFVKSLNPCHVNLWELCPDSLEGNSVHLMGNLPSLLWKRRAPPKSMLPQLGTLQISPPANTNSIHLWSLGYIELVSVPFPFYTLSLVFPFTCTFLSHATLLLTPKSLLIYTSAKQTNNQASSIVSPLSVSPSLALVVSWWNTPQTMLESNFLNYYDLFFSTRPPRPTSSHARCSAHTRQEKTFAWKTRLNGLDRQGQEKKPHDHSLVLPVFPRFKMKQKKSSAGLALGPVLSMQLNFTSICGCCEERRGFSLGPVFVQLLTREVLPHDGDSHRRHYHTNSV